MSKYAKGPRTHRELRIYSAGQFAGMRNVYLAQARSSSISRASRTQLVRQAREHHWTYLARLREANGAPGYFLPETKDTPPQYSAPNYVDGWFQKRQAG